MLKLLKAPLTAVLLSSVAVVPATTIAFMATADMAVAKSDNAGGNGGGNGNAGGNGKGGSSKAKSGGSNGKSASASSGGGGGSSRGHGGLDKFINKLTGKDKARAAKTRTQPAKVASAEPKARPNDDPMHPSNLGKMNGALNASINAVTAHIRNGNTNGPVGAMAYLAVSAKRAEGAQEVIDAEANHAALETELANAGYANVEDYLEARNGTGPDAAIEAAIAKVESLEEDDEGYQDALDELDIALGDYETVQDYYDARDGNGGDSLIDEKIAALGGDAATGAAPTVERPDADQIAEATDALEAKVDAESNILSQWNKRDTAPAETETLLLDALYQRIADNQEAIDAAIAETEAAAATDETAEEPVEGDDLTECTGDETDCGAPDEEDLAAVE